MKSRAIVESINSSVVGPVKAASFLRRIRNMVARYPSIYIPAIRLTGRRDFVVRRNTELVIEGYPRSGNSFAHAAFRLAQNRPICLAHHCHAPAQVIAAHRWQIPALVIFREPDDAVKSLLLFSPEIYTTKEAYREYVNFYEPLLQIREGYVLASFETVTKDFGEVIRSVNSRFETEFNDFYHSEVMVKKVFAEVDRIARITSGTNKPAYDVLQRNDYRERLSSLQARISIQLLEDKQVAKQRAKAKILHDTLLGLSDV